VFDVGFWELTFIMTLALLVLGPDKLPGMVRSLGRWMGRARAVARNLRVQIEREVAEMPTPPSAKTTPKQDPSEPTINAAGSDAGPAPDPAPGTDNKPNEISDVAEPAGEKGSDPGIRF
jgi:sec-independent protein translocase protein TatB